MSKTKDYIHLHELIFNKPHLCTPEYAETVLAVVGDKLGVDQGAFSIDGEGKREQKENLSNGTLVLPIIGSMVHRGGSLDALSGIQSYQSIQASIQDAVDDTAVKRILLDIDSPGGSVAGAFDLKDFITIAKENKPIYAIARDSMASAAYLIGSACTKVFATQTAQVGSIGVVAMHMDRSELNKKEGLKPTFIYAGDLKVAGNPHEKLEGEALDYIKESVQESYEMFVEAVADSRGLDKQMIRDTEARVYKGSKAKELGLVDEVISFDALLEELANEGQQRVSIPSSMSKKGIKMDKEELEKLEADYAQATADVKTLKGENEKLRKALIDNGFKITAEGIEPKEVATEEVVKETLEVNGKTVDLSAMPEEAAQALKDLVEQKAESDLEAKASEMFPNMDLSAAKEFAKADLTEDALKALKAADNMFGNQMEEVGEDAQEGDLTDPKEKLDALIEDHMDTNGVDLHKARVAVSQTKEGRALQKAIRKG